MLSIAIKCLALVVLLMSPACSGKSPSAFSINQTNSSDDGKSIAHSEGLDSLDIADSGPVPKLNLTATNVPAGKSDAEILVIPIEADPAFSYYAYRVSQSGDCASQNGFTVNPINKPITVKQTNLPIGEIFLCLRGFHTELNRWQPVKDNKTYRWQKIPFERFYKTFFEVTLTPAMGCDKPTLTITPSTVSILGDEGLFTAEYTAAPNCPGSFQGTIVNRIVGLRKTGTQMIGVFIEGEANGWIEFNFTDAERNNFKGSWGYGEYGSKAEGAWSTVP